MSRSVPCLSLQCVTFFLFAPLGITISVKTVCLLNMHLLIVKWKKLTSSSGTFFKPLPGIQRVSPFIYNILFSELLKFSEFQVFICGLNIAKDIFLLCFSRNIQFLLNINYQICTIAYMPSQQSTENDTLT